MELQLRCMKVYIWLQLISRMELTPGMQNLTEYCKSAYEKAETVIHQWGHIQRTTNGAVWFCSILGGTEREQQLAYVSGILHDIVRPTTEEICHAQASAEKALTIIGGYPEFTDSEKHEIYQAIKDHRKPVPWKSPLHQSVYLSDKICEHMGAYLDFRAPAWAGELSHSDFRGLKPVEAVLHYYEKVSYKFLTERYPNFVKDLVNYQTGWNRRYVDALKSNEGWAVEMAEKFFYSGRGKEDFEKTLLSFNPKGNQREWVNEMRDYTAGKKFQHFRNLIGATPV